MSGLWITYFVTIGVVIFLTALAKMLFTYDGDELNITYIIFIDLISAVPFVGTLEAFIVICLLFMGIVEGTLEPKYEK